ncbi:unnamed protein product [Rotaria sp. Silwood1]|nr:unnamed protein product [Rotaria sp. Silwood1]CAF0770341.1 unnamed protein product [Rotaria sp. Silwood1]
MNVNDVQQDEWYTVYCGPGKFILPLRYQNIALIGQGTYGIVVRATDTTTGKYVAIKKLLHPFQCETLAKRTYRELKFLIYLNHHNAQDLKPTNIGIDKDSNVTILDFGLASVASANTPTIYVSTRWWRAPEIYINEEKYNEKIDLWSVGCIMAELILLKPLFPGEDAIDQLNKILDITGTPDSTTIQEICIPGISAYISQKEPKPKRDFNELFGFKYDPLTQNPISGISPEGVDLLDRLLSFDPRQRPTAEQALSHRFLEFYHDPIEEPTIEPISDEHQNVKHTRDQWKSIVWQMVQEFVPPSWVNDDSMDDS